SSANSIVMSSSSSSSSSSSLPYVYGCRTLDVPDREYRQQAGIIAAVDTGGGCITINAPNVTFDCQDYAITNDSFDSAGVYSDQDGTMIRNCNVSVGSDAGYGIKLYHANNSRVYNSDLDYQAVGIQLESSNNAIIENVTLYNNTLGAFLVSSSDNNITRMVVSTLTNETLTDAVGLEDALPIQTTAGDERGDDGRPSNPEGKSVIPTIESIDRLDGKIPYDARIGDGGGTYSLIGIAILNGSLRNTLSNVIVNRSVFGIVIGRSSHYSTLSNVRANLNVLGITIGNSSYSRLYGVATTGNILHILIIRNSSHTNLTSVSSNIGLLGITVAGSNYNTFSSVGANWNILGFGLYSSNYSNFTGIRAFNNTLSGFAMTGSAGNIIRNANLSENGYYDFIMGAVSGFGSREECSNTLENVSSTGGRTIGYYNSPVSLSNGVFSELFLCGADGSVLDNVTIAGSDTKGNNGLVFYHTNASALSNINSSGNYFGLFVRNGFGNEVSNLSASNNTADGVYIDYGGYNSITGVTADYNGIDDWYDGIYVYYSVNNTISDVTAGYNGNDGVQLEESFNNTLSDLRCSNNSNDGVSLYDSSSNSFSRIASHRNTDYALQLYSSANNTFQDVDLSDSTDKDVYMSDSTNNILLNATYDLADEYAVDGSQLLRKWYFDAFVNDSLGNALEDANVTGLNVFGELAFNESTGPSGRINRVTLIWYVNNGTRTAYGNYTINASKSGYASQERSVDSATNLFETFTLAAEEF
ncbi:MAG: right-handed parallel beta-helix repeat-containing protein, partial [Candidatus Altiarchaeota archaeon]|nr:right-handed parallel beta-helix repeat-containing protein [Candidatus Altiarchaeota archaeon]